MLRVALGSRNKINIDLLLLWVYNKGVVLHPLQAGGYGGRSMRVVPGVGILRRSVWTALLAVMTLGLCAWGQNLTTGALSGVIKDASGAAIPGAKVTATNLARGSVHATETQINGSYLIPLLEPGQYSITIEKTGFQTAKQAGIGVSVSATGTMNFTLQVGASSQTVEVTGEPPLINPQNANTATTLDAKAIENLPNPGGDITMLAQVSPGASMMVHGGGGTAGLAFNGIQGNAVNYTFDGMDDNDPFNNDNNSGPSNMLLGQNAVAEMTVNTNSYSVDQGRMAAGQINYLSKSGSNDWHGNASWQWNGRSLNAYDYFVKAQPLAAGQTIAPKPFDNVNNWTGSVGGKIIKNKLFFFVDSEGTRIDLPHVANFTAPSQSYITYAEQQITQGGFDTDISTGSGTTYRQLPAEPAEAAFQKAMFGLYGDTSIGTHGNVQINQNTGSLFGCNLDPSFVTGGNPLGIDPSYNPQLMPTGNAGSKSPGTNPIPTADTGCEVKGILTTSAKTPETLTSFRVDYTLNASNTIWGKYSDDQGTQTTGISAINPVFNENSFQPDHQGVLDWTHIFTPTLTNDASTGFLWYSAIFDFNTPAAEHAAIGGLGSVGFPFTGVGSTSFPQGRNVTQYEAIDNLTWTHGNHSFKFGENFRRELVNDHDFAEDFASDTAANWSELDFAAASSAGQRFPISPVEQFKDFSLDLYAGDTWQVTPTLTLTLGLRATNNSNPVDSKPLIANFSDWTVFGHGAGYLNTAPNSAFQAQSLLWSSVPLEIWQPRFALAYQPHPNTLIKAGWGMFGQVATTSAAETLARNPPFLPSFTGGFGTGNVGGIGSAAGCGINSASTGQCGYLFDPSQAGSAVAAAAAANSVFQANFAGGALSCASPASLGPTQCVPPASISALPASGLKAPMVYNYSLTVQQQMGRNSSFSVGYVGTRSQHNSYTVGENGYQSVCNGCFAPYQFSSTGNAGAPDPRFLGYSQTRYDGYGRYDSMQAGWIQRLSHGITLNLNYTLSHCLTTGTPYSDAAGVATSLSNTYATCSDDITHVVNAAYTYTLPFHSSNSLLGNIVNGWMITGSTFSQGGQPVFIGAGGSSSFNSNLVQTSGPVHGKLVPGNDPYAKGDWLNVNSFNGKTVFSGTQTGAYQWFNPAAFAPIWDSTSHQCFNPATGSESKTPADCQFTGSNDAFWRGPGFQWTNFDVSKSFQLTERVNMRLDFQGYNVFNHPNFSNPSISAPACYGPSFNTTTGKGSCTGGGSFSQLAGFGEITSMASPNNGLLGDSNGGDSAPRMLAFQAKIIF